MLQDIGEVANLRSEAGIKRQYRPFREHIGDLYHRPVIRHLALDGAYVSCTRNNSKRGAVGRDVEPKIRLHPGGNAVAGKQHMMVGKN